MMALVCLMLFSSPTLLTVSDGDEAFVRIDYPSAAAIYDSVLATSPDSAAILWRLARVYVCMADIAPRDQKTVLYRIAEQYARREILADSTLAEGHTWLAAALGNIAMFEGSKAKVAMCHEIKKELETAITLNPDDDIAYSILGSFYLALGNVSWIERQLAAIFLGSLPDGGYKEAEAALKTAIKIAPDVVRHHFELGELYIKEDRSQEAIAEFQTATSLPLALASDEHTQALAVERINQLKEHR